MQRHRNHRRSGSRAGNALLASLVLVMSMAVLCAGYMQLSASRHREGKRSADAKRAFYIAEAGLSEAFMGLATGKNGNVGSDVVPARFANGLFWVTAEDAGDGRLALRSTGLCGTGRVALSMIVESDPRTVASLGFFGGQGLRVESGSTIDSYDSSLGRYELQEPGEAARVGCNEDITLQGTADRPTVIGGDVNPGPEGSVLRSNGVTVSGSTAPLDEIVVLPAIQAPAFARNESIVYSNKHKLLKLASGDYGLNELWLKPGASASLDGPATVVVDVLRVGAGSKLTLDGGTGPVTLFVLEELVLQQGSTLRTTSKVPETVTLLVDAEAISGSDVQSPSSPRVVMHASGEFHGTIYAPKADLELPRTFEVFGAITARSVTLESRSRLHFDSSLNASSALATGLPRMSCWRVVDVPRVELTSRRTDPMLALEHAGITPVPARDAHFDVGVAPACTDPDVVPFTGGLANRGLARGGTATAPPQAPLLSPAAAAMIARLDEVPAVATSQLTNELLAASPLHPSVLQRAIDRLPPLSSSELMAVLLRNAPLSQSPLDSLLARPSAMQSSHLKDVLIASSPLPSGLLSQLLALIPPPLSQSDLLSVLANQ